MGQVESYRDLKVWQMGLRISLAVYRCSKSFPTDEKFGMTSQMRRCAVSIPSNIAEGHARESTKEYLRHLSIARGSLAELETQMTIASELGYIESANYSELMQHCDEESRMLSGLQRSLRNRAAG